MNLEAILVPTDFSPDADVAVSTARDLAKKFGAKVLLLHAHHLDLPISGPFGEGAISLPNGLAEETRRAAQKAVDEIAERLRGEGIDVSGVVRTQQAVTSIVDLAEEKDIDLIVIGTRGNTGLKHVVLGSVAERVVRFAPCPVLTVKSESEAASP